MKPELTNEGAGPAGALIVSATTESSPAPSPRRCNTASVRACIVHHDVTPVADPTLLLVVG